MNEHYIKYIMSRDGKTYEHASNACGKLFLAWVKSVPNFVLMCHKFARCRVILMTLVNLLTFTLKRGKLVINHMIVASIYV